MGFYYRTSQHLSKSYSAGAFALAAILLAAQAVADPLVVESNWEEKITSDGTMATARHEAAGVVIGEDIYLVGGRGNRPMERYSTTLNRWENLGVAPRELHHFQPVAFDNKLYAIGAFTCCYPLEELVPEIHRYDPVTDNWDIAGSMPSARVRGSAAAFVLNDKIYVLGGNTQGHDGGAVAWFDEYDPVTGTWVVLPDAPNARDHFSATVIGEKVIAAAGRQTTLPNPSDNSVLATDIFDFATGLWSTTTDIPTARSGVVAVAYGDSVIVLGGEVNTNSQALKSVEAFDVSTQTWSALPSMITGRHGSGGGIVGQTLHIISGASSQGGATEINSHETLLLPNLAPDPDEEECENEHSEEGSGEEAASNATGSEESANESSEESEESSNCVDNQSASGCSVGGGNQGLDGLLLLILCALCRLTMFTRASGKQLKV